ncbi:MAG: hypothetical protein LBU39_01380 [Desulfobulbaceae bacterium]|jgi:hypothetical protein|nr:hypothetical protein [Desulfobulbaceae bacterium]
MRKVIVAGAALFLAATMSGGLTATAEAAKITFTGDARARFYAEKDYATTTLPTTNIGEDKEESYWQSRVRLVFKIETKGGAYAMGRFRLADTWPGSWDGGQSTLKYGEGSNLRTDVSYVGLPLGPFTVEAGVGPNTMSEFIRSDVPYDFVRAKFEKENTTVLAFMEKFDEYEETSVPVIDAATGLSVDKLVIDDDYTSDDDINHYGLQLIQKFGDGWVLNAAALMKDDQQHDEDGWAGVASVMGKVGEIGLIAEAAFKNAAYQGNDDDGYGGYIGAKMPIGPASISVTFGGTFDGFTASGDFGGDGQEGYAPFIMVGNAGNTEVIGMMNTGILLGSASGDAWFVNAAPSIRVSDKLTLLAEVSYVDTDTPTGSLSLVEVGGMASYQVVEGASVTALLGYLDIEDSDADPLGFGLALDLTF